MNAHNASTVMVDSPELNLSRQFDAEPARVFAAFVQPERLAAWFGPEGASCATPEIDARVGGRYRFTIIGDDSCNEHTIMGEYLEVIADERLVFTWAWLQEDGNPGDEMLVELTFEATDGGTNLMLRQTGFVDSDIRDKHEFGWTSSFNDLVKSLAI